MSALDKSTRRKIFYTLALLFLLAAPLIILYSRGYIVDLASFSFVPTGGIFVKTLIPGARVFLDQNLVKETSFISRGALLTDLLPGRYTLRVEQTGRAPWSKVVRVQDGQVVEFRSIFLPPATITPSAVFNLRQPLPARLRELSGRPEIAVEVGDPQKPFTLFVVDPQARRASLNSPAVSRWRWDAAGSLLYLGRIQKGKTLWYRLSMEPGRREEKITFRGLPEGFSAEDLTPHPGEAGHFYFLAGGALFLETEARVPTPIAEQVYAYAVARERIYYVAKNGFFVSSSLEGRDTLVLGRKGLVLDSARPVEFTVSPSGVIALLDSAGGLFLYRPGIDPELQFLAAGVSWVDFNRDSDRLVYGNAHRAWLYWIGDNRRQPFQVAGTRTEILSAVEPIQRAFLDAEGVYLFYATPSGLSLSEADSRATPNAYELVVAPITDFLLQRDSLAILWVQGAELFRASLK